MNLTFPGWAPSVHHFDEIYAIFPVWEVSKEDLFLNVTYLH